MGEISRGDIGVLQDDSRSWSKELTLVAPYLEEAPSVEFCGDIVMRSTTPSIGLINPICSEPLELTPTSSLLPPTTPSPAHAFRESLSDRRGYYPSFDPYCAYLEDMPRKIMSNTLFDHTFDFSMVFGKFKRH